MTKGTPRGQATFLDFEEEVREKVPTRRVAVRLEPEDLGRGIPRSSRDCPLARAINRRLRPGWHVSVGRRDLVVLRNGRTYGREAQTVNLPPTSADWVASLDAGLRPPPVVLPVDLPVKTVREESR